MAPDEARAYRAGAGDLDPATQKPWTLDHEDEDMVDAAMLGSPDGMGGSWWKPSSLEDIHALPPRVLRLFMAYRAGISYASTREKPPEKTGTIGGKKLA